MIWDRFYLYSAHQAKGLKLVKKPAYMYMGINTQVPQFLALSLCRLVISAPDPW